MQAILLLTQYFTRIPVKKTLDYTEKAFREASFFLSLHAAFVAVIPMAAALLFTVLQMPVPINALLTLTVSLAVTGAFHLDGFADTMDGLFSGRSKERILEIMKDPTMGSYGTIGIFLDLALKYFIYAELIRSGRIFLLPLMAGAGKLALALTAHIGRRAKAESSANALIQNVPSSAVLVNFGLCTILAFTLRVLPETALALVALFVCTLGFTAYCHRKIHGIVGDNLGFSAEAGEIILGIFLVWL